MKPKGSFTGRAVAVVVGLAVLGVVGYVGYNSEDVGTYMSLQGWNSGAAEAHVRKFVQEAGSGAANARELLDASWVQPVEKGGKLVAVKHSGAAGPVEVPIKKIVPSGEVKSVSSRIRYKVKSFQVAVEYPNGKWAAFDVTRKNGNFQIVGVPDDLTDEKPQPQPWD